MKHSPGQVIGSSFALCAFAVAVLAGLWAGNDAGTVLLRALGAMVLCYALGVVAGLLCQYVVDRSAPNKNENAGDLSAAATRKDGLSGVEAAGRRGRVVDEDQVMVV